MRRSAPGSRRSWTSKKRCCVSTANPGQPWSKSKRSCFTLRREYTRILEESDRFVLAKLFWLRDGQTIGVRTLRDAVAGVMITADRVQGSVRAALALIPLGQAGAVRFWVLVALVGVGLPWVALWGSARLRSWIASFLATDSTEAFGTRSTVAALIVIQTAIWPAYLVLVAWAWPRIINVEQQTFDPELSLLAGVQWIALVLWGWLLARALLRPRAGCSAIGVSVLRSGRALQQTVTVGMPGDVGLSGATPHPGACSWRTGGSGGESGAGPAVLYRLPGCAPGTGDRYRPPWESVDDRGCSRAVVRRME
jgi:hypothetical protein